MLGLAVGNALGTTLEFSPPGSFAPIDDIVGGGPFRLSPGGWTDDTSMALCLAESLIECGGFDAAEQMRPLRPMVPRGVYEARPGAASISAILRAPLYTGEPWCGSDDPCTAGNGSIVRRLAPIVLAFAPSPSEAITTAARSSRTTHGARDAVEGCRYLAALLLGALGGASKEELLAGVFEPLAHVWVHEPLAPAVTQVAEGSFRRRNPPAIRRTVTKPPCGRTSPGKATPRRRRSSSPQFATSPPMLRSYGRVIRPPGSPSV
jgi:ADP-ribosyl-[dinitrogen reductase] hydrolase